MKIEDVIIDEMSFSVNFGIGKVYHVYVFTENIDYSDEYAMEVTNIYTKEKILARFDSSGDILRGDFENNEVLNKIHEYLFDTREQTVIQEF